MKTLNRTLSLALVFALVFSLMSFAFAADTTTTTTTATTTTATTTAAKSTTFTDQSSIKNTQAVQTNVALNIINGRDTGAFDPTGIVTRAEMCKMITIAMNGGVTPTLGTKTTPTYTDIKGHWAEAYVEYCANLGIVAGMGDGTFAPNKTITGSQAAKMLLVALGYKADVEKFTGTDWEINVNTVAMKKGLYTDLAISASADLTRDSAAQMVYNSLYAILVEYSYGITGSGSTISGVAQAKDNEKGYTFLSKYYKLQTTSGYLTAINYDKTNKIYTYSITKDTTSGLTNTVDTFKSADDYSDMFGMQVNVFWKDKVLATTTPYTFDSTVDSVYDIVTKDSAVLATANNGMLSTYDATNKTLVVGTTKLDLANGLTFNCFTDFTAGSAATGYKFVKLSEGASYLSNGTTAFSPATFDIKLIDNNKDGKVDTLVVLPFTIEKVSYTGSTSTTVTAAASTTLTNKDVNLYSGIAKDDVVADYAATASKTGIRTLVKQTLMSAPVTAVKGDKTLGTYQYQVGGYWFTSVDVSKWAAGTRTQPTSDYVLAASDPDIGDTISFAHVGLVVPYLKVTAKGTTSKNILAVYAVGDDNTGAFTNIHTLKAKVITADGTKSTVTVSKVNGTDVGTTTSQISLLTVGNGYTYVVDSDGAYQLTAIGYASNYAGYDGSETETSPAYNAKKVGTYELADDAVVYWVDNNASPNTAKIYTGKELKNNYTGTLTCTGISLYSAANGFTYTRVAVLTGTAPTINTGANYGYLTADAYKTVESSKNYVNYTMWTKDGSKTYKQQTDDTDISMFAAGAVVTFDLGTTEGTVKNVKPADITNGCATGSSDTAVAINNTNYKITSDSIILDVDETNRTGVEGKTIPTGDGVTPNVRYIADSTGIVLLVAATNNEIKPVDSVVDAGAAPTTAALNKLLRMYAKVKVSGTLTGTDAVVVPSGSLLLITGNTILPNAMSPASIARIVGYGGTYTLTATSAAALSSTYAPTFTSGIHASTNTYTWNVAANAAGGYWVG